MIVNVRLEVTNEQRNALARRNKPSAPKRLATRAEVREYVESALAGIDEGGANEAPAPQDVPEAPGETPLQKAVFSLTNASFLVGDAQRSLWDTPHTVALSKIDKLSAKLTDLKMELTRDIADQKEAA